MNLMEERNEIIKRLTERYEDLGARIRLVSADQAKAESDLEDAGTHDVRENAARTQAKADFARAVSSKAALIRVQAVGLDFITNYVPSDFVSIGTTVKLLNVDTKQEYCKMIVPPDAGGAALGATIVTAPVGKAIIGKNVGDTVVVVIGSKCINYKILELY